MRQPRPQQRLRGEDGGEDGGEMVREMSLCINICLFGKDETDGERVDMFLFVFGVMVTNWKEISIISSTEKGSTVRTQHECLFSPKRPFCVFSHHPTRRVEQHLNSTFKFQREMRERLYIFQKTLIHLFHFRTFSLGAMFSNIT